jgi:hypothetical protein
MGLLVLLSINDIQHYDTQYILKYLITVMVSVVMLNVVMLSVVMLSVVAAVK